MVKNEFAFHYGVVPSARLQLQSTKIVLGLSPRTQLQAITQKQAKTVSKSGVIAQMKTISLLQNLRL